jgi:hypothetical protein
MEGLGGDTGALGLPIVEMKYRTPISWTAGMIVR